MPGIPFSALRPGNKIVGPWPCEQCKHISQFAEIGVNMNRIFCRNEHCRFTRVIDKSKTRILEPDGTMWYYDQQGRKIRITRQ